MAISISFTPKAINLTELKAFCRVDTSTDDALLTMLYSAAMDEALSYSHVALGNATVSIVTEWVSSYELPIWPIGAISLVEVDDVADTAYEVLNGIVCPSVIGEKLEITYAAGFGASVPMDAIHAVYQRVKFGYDYGDDLPSDRLRFFDRVLFRYKRNFA